MYDLKHDPDCPFTPGHIVDFDDFVGREGILDEILRYAPSIKNGKNTHFYLVGKTGMGKSSLSAYVGHIFENKYNMLVIPTSNKGINDLDSLITSIIESLINTVKTESWGKKILSSFGDNIESVGLFNLKLKFKPKNELELESLKDDFAFFLKDICKYLNKKNGLVIIIDDVNGLSKNKEFALWYKSFVNNMDMKYPKELPVSFILTSYPQNYEKLQISHPPFARIFNKINVENLTDDEVKSFYTQMFRKIGLDYDKEALELLIKYTFGIPLMMQLIGETIFWNLKQSEKITLKKAFDTILKISDILLERYLHKTIQLPKYKKILQKISTLTQPNSKEYFTLSQLKEFLLDEEKDMLEIFLYDSVNVGMLNKIDYGVNNKYEFINPLYISYLKIQNLKLESW